MYTFVATHFPNTANWILFLFIKAKVTDHIGKELPMFAIGQGKKRYINFHVDRQVGIYSDRETCSFRNVSNTYFLFALHIAAIVQRYWVVSLKKKIYIQQKQQTFTTIEVLPFFVIVVIVNNIDTILLHCKKNRSRYIMEFYQVNMCLLTTHME